jgi:hypothetical protein
LPSGLLASSTCSITPHPGLPFLPNRGTAIREGKRAAFRAPPAVISGRDV